MSPTPASDSPITETPFPHGAGVLFGIGLGGMFDGIVLHQLLQWHHMLSSRFPPTTLANLQLNTRWDGLFHSATYIVVVIALYQLWRAARREHRPWPARWLWGTGLIGFGAFNLVEGIVDHYLLGLHHVNEQVARESWGTWDAAFLLWGAAMVVVGMAVLASGWRPGAKVDAHGA